jgi:hypothetical protein
VPCFTPGTLVVTPKGEIPVEDLTVGTPVLTRDNGVRALVHAASVTLDFGMLAARPHLRPVLIRLGALDPGEPERDMLVSPNLRLLVDSGRSALHFSEHEALSAAKHLVNSRDIRPVEALGVTYVHIHFDRHQVVLANGIWAEAFDPRDRSLGGLGNAQRNELGELFAEVGAPSPLARRRSRAAELLRF